MRFWIFAVAGCAALFVPSASAQIPGINPGAIENESRRQQQQIERQLQRQRQIGPSVVGPARPQSPLLQPGGPKFVLRKVVFSESKFLTSADLDPIAALYVGKRVDFSDLQALLAAVNELYQKRGIITGIATLPPQKVDGGVLRIQLTEGRLGRSSMEGTKQTSRWYIFQRVRLPKPGEVVDVPQVSRDITWFNRTNDTQIKALLQPGSTFGLTDIQLAVVEPPINTLQIFYDNQGVKSTGRYQGGAYYRLHGLAGFDDRFTFYGTRSRGNGNYNVAYNIPFNPWGGRIGASYTQGAINIIEGPFRSLDVTGESTMTSLNATQPVYADESWLILANGAYTRARSVTDLGQVTVTDDKSQKNTAGFTIGSYSDIHNLTFSPAFNSVDSYSTILQRTRSFETYTAQFSAYVRLPANFSLSVLGSGQYTEAQLLPGDQLFQIGGPTTVRGYPTNAVAGDSGYYVNFELHWNAPDIVRGLDVYIFHDRGDVYSTSPAIRRLASNGIGMSLTPWPAFTIEASYARPLIDTLPNQPNQQIYTRVIFRPFLLPGIPNDFLFNLPRPFDQ